MAGASERPNVVVIMTDNHGAWTLGCYGNPDIRTPNIDRLAREGVLLTRAMANNAVCSPTRATFLTGLMPSQHGVHRYLGAGGAQIGSGAYCMIGEFRTLPKILREAGYVCGLSGKWHLGGNLRPQEGFSYWITKPHGHSRGFYDQQVIENGAIRNEPGYLTDLWTDHGIKFIEQNKDRPFFLLLAYNGPYGLGTAMKEPIRNRHKDLYAGRDLPSFPREDPHPWGHNYPHWIGDLAIIRKYAAEISGIDDGVGRILQTLSKHGLDEKTLVIFTADQGLAGGQSGFWGMGDHTRPLTAYDWTMWIPLIFRHPGHLPPGRRLNPLVSNYDLLPTLLSYLNLPDKLPGRPELPGRDMTPLLRGQFVDWDDVVFYEFENVRAVRTDRWKYIERIHEEPSELYDIAADPGERNNLYGRPEHRAIQAEMHSRLASFFRRYADPKWDLWNGGRAKTNLITGKLFGLDNRSEGRLPSAAREP
jgi:arylsulfatase A-like enzyme